MKRLLREIAGLSSRQWATLISLLVGLNIVVVGGLVWVIVSEVLPQHTAFTQMVLAQAPATRTPNPTFTPSLKQATLTPFPSATSTLVATWTPSITPTPSPTPIPTDTPIPTNTPVVVLARANKPAAPPTATPTPNVDFAANVRQLTACENNGKHHIFVNVVDQNGSGMPGMTVRVAWPGGESFLETGDKEEPGLADFAMFKGEYTVEVMGVLSEVVGPITPNIPKDEPCHENGNAVGNSLFHYSYDVEFRKVR